MRNTEMGNRKRHEKRLVRGRRREANMSEQYNHHWTRRLTCPSVLLGNPATYYFQRKGRERQRQRERETERHRERQRDRDRETQRERERETETETERQRERDRERETERARSIICDFSII